MAEIREKWQELRSRVQSGQVGKFLRWWLGELRQAMPASWQEKLQHAMRRVTLVPGRDSLSVGVDENRRITELATFLLSRDATLQRQEIDDVLQRHDLLEAPRFLLLDRSDILVKELKLPVAAEPNLAQVLSFEMDRQTPFRASSVYFDWKIVERGMPPGQLRLQLYVVPRSEVDGAVASIRNRGLALAGVDIRDGGQTLGVNLLPVEQRVRTVNPRTRFNFALGAACVVLLVVVMAQSLYLRAHQISELEGAIEAVQDEAREVARIRKQIEDASAAAGFLASRRAEAPLAIEVLADVTRILPDDTYLDRLVIGPNSVQMQGKSQNAQQLIEKVNESPLLDAAAFRGSTRLDARTGLEIFEVNASLAPAPAAPRNPAPAEAGAEAEG
ncbi:MAG: PilN domain-containing protein [Xanthomonadales bacterium]|nr:PilN domain-containing protein [Xanthomonadales bacterium]